MGRAEEKEGWAGGRYERVAVEVNEECTQEEWTGEREVQEGGGWGNKDLTVEGKKGRREQIKTNCRKPAEVDQGGNSKVVPQAGQCKHLNGGGRIHPISQ